MRIAIFSDLHANADALAALGESYDEFWFLGDMVGYGPDVEEAVDFVRSHCAVVLQGNHDAAAVFDVPIGCSPQNEPVALATRDYTRSRLGDEQTAYLRSLSPIAAIERDGVRFSLAHGSPRDPLYEYVRPSYTDSDLCVTMDGIEADVLLLGHTHLPMRRQIGATLVFNPGSLGQPRDGDWHASFAVWEDGELTLHRKSYARDRQLTKIEGLPIASDFRAYLRGLLVDARVPEPGPTRTR